VRSPNRREFLAGAAGAVAVALPGTATAAEAAAHSAPLEAADCAADPTAPKHQLRGMWIATVVNIDWPSRPGLPVDEQQAELISLYDTAVDKGFNTVVVQVRPTADAFWPSPYEPWSKYLSGTQGQGPGYDPLEFAVREAHARNLRIHGWFNPYRVSMDTDLDALVPTHPARVHPDWAVPYGPKLYYNPGIPAVRRFVITAIMDAVRRYDLDGVHFDDYYYPYPVAGVEFPDDDAFASYGAGFADRADWRRNNINLLITELVAAIHARKPHVQFGSSPFAVWRNIGTDPRGSDTTAGAQTYDDLYADTRRWVRAQWIDYIAPQVYWTEGFAAADYDKIVDWWSGQIRDSHSRTRLYIGQATYKIGTSTQSPEWINDPEEMSNHLTFNQKYPQVSGDIFYNASSVVADLLGATTLVSQQHYQHPALVPTMPWLDSHAPPPVLALRRSKNSLEWRSVGAAACTFLIYRFDGRVRPKPCQYADATSVVAALPAEPGKAPRTVLWTDPTADPAQAYTYAVTAADELGNESAPRLTHP
jgi:uncharacterized lipoprotein YddW (UPF0748 family)